MSMPWDEVEKMCGRLDQQHLRVLLRIIQLLLELQEMEEGDSVHTEDEKDKLDYKTPGAGMPITK